MADKSKESSTTTTSGSTTPLEQTSAPSTPVGQKRKRASSTVGEGDSGVTAAVEKKRLEMLRDKKAKKLKKRSKKLEDKKKTIVELEAKLERKKAKLKRRQEKYEHKKAALQEVEDALKATSAEGGPEKRKQQ